MKAALALTAALCVVTTPVLAECSAEDFELIKPMMHHKARSRYLRITGEVLNNCAEPAGVQLRLVQRGPDDEVVGVEEFWPASISNIAPGDRFPFDLVFDWRNPAKGKSKLTIIGARRWDD